jgi:integrase
MSKALTAVVIEKHKYKPTYDKKGNLTRYEIPDAAQRGLYVVVFPSGAKSFICRYRFGGQKRKLTFGGISLAAARKAAAAALFDVHEGRDPALAKKIAKQKAANAAADTVQAICEEYLKREGGKLRTADQRETLLQRLVYPSAIASQPIDTVTRSQLVRLFDKIEDDCGARTADLALAYLRKVFNWHALRTDTFKSPIIAGMGRYNGKAHERERVLNDDEIRAIWKATERNRPGSPFIRFLLLTGARRSEACLRWDEIHGDVWDLPAARNKTKVDLQRPLSRAALALIDAQPRIDGDPLVFQFIRSFSLVKKDIDAASGVANWRLHDLRRTARTLLSRAGVSADIAERCLGHAVGGVRAVYDRHRYLHEMREAFEALATLIERIVNPPADVVTPMRRKGQRHG